MPFHHHTIHPPPSHPAPPVIDEELRERLPRPPGQGSERPGGESITPAFEESGRLRTFRGPVELPPFLPEALVHRAPSIVTGPSSDDGGRLPCPAPGQEKERVLVGREAPETIGIDPPASPRALAEHGDASERPKPELPGDDLDRPGHPFRPQLGSEHVPSEPGSVQGPGPLHHMGTGPGLGRHDPPTRLGYEQEEDGGDHQLHQGESAGPRHHRDRVRYLSSMAARRSGWA